MGNRIIRKKSHEKYQNYVKVWMITLYNAIYSLSWSHYIHIYDRNRKYIVHIITGSNAFYIYI